ncbi:MAG: radical SAM/SPASM domain-containing protein [Candidatus Krumholzibacteriia bacterium]
MTPQPAAMPQPQNAIVAVTLNCNARCEMCDIWQNDMHDEAPAEVFGRLPASLRDINISGGEPFLRSDLPDILAAIKRSNPRARLVISTNGFQPGKTKRMMPAILDVDPKVAIRVSIDGLDGTHDEIRGIPNGFKKCEQTLDICRSAGVHDLGVGFTLLEKNVHELADVHRFTEGRNLQLSITVATDSSIYFGENKEGMRPQSSHAVRQAFGHIIDAQYRKWNLKENFRAWFNRTMMEYHETSRRRFRCDGGSGFFYMDSFANIYVCHILNVRIGNLIEQSWEELWTSQAAEKGRAFAAGCDKCWLICTSKSQIYENKWRIGTEMLRDKIKTHLRIG